MAKLIKTKPHPRFGATKAQGKRNQELRDRDNQIFQLKQQLARLAAYEPQMNEMRSALDMAKRELAKPCGCGMDAAERMELTVLRRERHLYEGKCDGLLAAIKAIASGKVAP